MDNKDIVSELKVKDKWFRGLFMLLFLAAIGAAKALLLLIGAFQFLHVLVTGKTNKNLLPFSKELIIYVCELYSFVVYTSEHKPFPFASWPKSKANSKIKSDSSNKTRS